MTESHPVDLPDVSIDLEGPARPHGGKQQGKRCRNAWSSRTRLPPRAQPCTRRPARSRCASARSPRTGWPPTAGSPRPRSSMARPGPRTRCPGRSCHHSRQASASSGSGPPRPRSRRRSTVRRRGDGRVDGGVQGGHPDVAEHGGPAGALERGAVERRRDAEGIARVEGGHRAQAAPGRPPPGQRPLHEPWSAPEPPVQPPRGRSRRAPGRGSGGTPTTPQAKAG